jgi:hypothetical protein
MNPTNHKTKRNASASHRSENNVGAGEQGGSMAKIMHGMRRWVRSAGASTAYPHDRQASDTSHRSSNTFAHALQPPIRGNPLGDCRDERGRHRTRTETPSESRPLAIAPGNCVDGGIAGASFPDKDLVSAREGGGKSGHDRPTHDHLRPLWWSPVVSQFPVESRPRTDARRVVACVSPRAGL